jgi:hypothetical protein
MELSPTWKTARCAVTQELPNSLCNPKVQCQSQKSPPLVHILSQINPVHTTPSYLHGLILILSFHLYHGLSCCSFLLAFQPKPMCTTLIPIVLRALPTSFAVI